MTVFEKLADVQQSLIAPKNQFNKFGGYNYRSCEDILEGLKPCLKKVKATIRLSDEIIMVGERIYVMATATFTDAESGESINNTAFAREEDSAKGMSAAQCTGSSSSYARKYALNGLFCIDDVKDADTRDNREESKKKTDSAKASADHMKRISDQCESTGTNPSVILAHLGIEKMSDMTEEQYKDVCKNWSKIVNG